MEWKTAVALAAVMALSSQPRTALDNCDANQAAPLHVLISLSRP